MAESNPAPAPFEGFSSEAFGFFAALARNNNRDWFQARKATFERQCKLPFQALAQALNPPEGAEHITRIHRDVRFSKDKTPYNVQLSAIVQGTYLQISAQGLYVGTGLYMPAPAVLNRMRAAIAHESSGRALETLVNKLRAKGYVVDCHERVTSAPRGYSAEHPRIELLRMKDIHAGRILEPAVLGNVRSALAAVRKVRADVAALAQWLDSHVRRT